MNVPVDLTNTVLKTDRLTLRPFTMNDLDDFYEYAKVDGVGQMAGWLPHQNREESEMILHMFIDEKKTFAIEYEGKVIGSLGIEMYNEERFPEFDDVRAREIGYVLSKDYWGRGMIPEAVSEVIRYLFEEMKLDVIFCGYFLWNRQSERVMEKCGFVHYSYDRFKTRMGTVEDDEVRILKREDWMNNR